MSNPSELLRGVPLIESPLFSQSLDSMDLSEQERETAVQLNQRGYAVIDFPDPHLDARIDRIKANLVARFGDRLMDPESIKNTGDLRVQDAWRSDEDVKAIAANSEVIALLSKLYGRKAFPFQTLNFPVGTQQQKHSDAVHFSSQPERFMCGVWLAMEDIKAEAGPLCYCPGSHKWPIISNAMIGRRGWNSSAHSAQSPFERVWEALVDASGIQEEIFLARKGQALIWTANLLHGGSVQTDPRLTRWSQVTHYYFDDCIYYTPAFSDEPLGKLDLRSIIDIASGEIKPNTLLGEPATPVSSSKPLSFLARLGRRFRPKAKLQDLPDDFDSEAYYRLNPDVLAEGDDAASHYLNHGRLEGRRYRAD